MNTRVVLEYSVPLCIESLGANEVNGLRRGRRDVLVEQGEKSPRGRAQPLSEDSRWFASNSVLRAIHAMSVRIQMRKQEIASEK